MKDNDISKDNKKYTVISKKSILVPKQANPKLEADSALKKAIKESYKKKLEFIKTLDLKKITRFKSSRSNENYSESELRNIAKKLGLVASQNKNELVNQILGLVERLKRIELLTTK